MSNGVIRITVANVIIIGLSSLFFERMAKLLLAKYRVNGLSELVGA